MINNFDHRLVYKKPRPHLLLVGLFFLLLGLLLLVWLIPLPSFGLDLDNKSGYDFAKVWVTKHKTHNWKLVTNNLKSGSGVEIPIISQNYDLRVQYTKGRYEIWEDFDSKVNRITITILPDKRWQAHYE
jgi:hypothetical protein